MTLRVEWLLSLGVVLLGGCGLNARVEPLRGEGEGADGGVTGGGGGENRAGNAGAKNGPGGSNHGEAGTNGIAGAAGSADLAGSGGEAACVSQEGEVCGGGNVLGVNSCSCADGLVCQLPNASSPATCVRPSPCTYGGHTYQPGEGFKCDCNQCTCIDGNRILSTTMACVVDGGGGSTPEAGPSPCTYGGHTYQPGEGFKCDCNQCTCIDGNRILSTTMACAVDGGGGSTPEAGTSPCTYDGHTYTTAECAPDAGTTREAGPQACDDAILALSSKVRRGANMECSAVLRLDHRSYAPLGYSIACADETATAITEAQAREIGRTATGYPEPGSGDLLLSDPRSSAAGIGDELYLFYEQPHDFGGTSVVHARNALALFGGSIVWAGTGHITYPVGWGSAVDLGSGCGSAHSSYTFSPVHAYGGGGVLTGSDASAASQAMSAALDTALPGALVAGNQASLKGATVLLYYPSVGGGDPNLGEWIIFMNAGPQ